MKHLLLGFFLILQLMQIRAQSCFSLYISTVPATPGGTVCLDVKAEGIDNLLGFQYTMKWDTSALHFNHLENFNLPGLAASSFSTQPSAVDNGRLSVSWFDGSLGGVDVSSGQVAYSICFDVGDVPDALHSVYFDRAPTPIEFVNANTELVGNYSLVNGGAYTGSVSAPAITYACTLPPDCQGGAGSVEVTFADDQQLYTFDWRKGGVTVSTSSSLSGDIGGRYSLTATGQQGMAASALFSVVPQGLPYISNWEIHNASCGVANDGNISVSIPGGAGDNSLSWNNGATGPQVFGLAPGQYILEVSNPGGCSYEEYYTVGQNAGPVVEASVRDADCNADNGQIDINVAYDPSNTIDYAWSHGEVALGADSLAPGAYTLTVTESNGCSAVHTYEVQRTGQLDYLYAVVQPSCTDGSDGSIDIQMPNAGPYEFIWSTGEATEDISGLAPGDYFLTISNQDGSCTDSRQFFLQETDIETYYSYECSEDAGNYSAALTCTVASGGTSPFIFSWSTGQVDTSQEASTISGVPGTGDYAVTITDAAGCVQEVDTFELDCSLAAQFLTAYSYECRFFADNSSLADVSLVVWSGGAPPYTFEWSNGEVDVDSLFSVNEALPNGIYTVTITDANGLVYYPEPAIVDCGSVAPDFTVGSSYECTYFPMEDSVSIDITTVVWAGPEPPYTFSWSTGEVQTDTMQSVITVSAPGAYIVTITDAAGNIYEESVSVGGCGPVSGHLAIGEAVAAPGGTVCVDVTAAQLPDLDSLLLAINWNPGFMSLYAVQPGLLATGFVLSDTLNGIFHLDWGSGGQPLNITGEEVLFQLCFNVLAPAGQGIPIDFHTGLQAPEAYDSNGQAAGISWQDGAVFVEDNTSGNAVQLNVQSAAVEPGTAVCLDITTANFTDIISVQFTVRWNADSLTFDSLVYGSLPGLGDTNFNLNNTGSGFLQFSWISGSLAPVTLSDGASLFGLCFTSAPTPGNSTVTISSVPLVIEVTDGSVVLPVAVTNGAVSSLQPEVWPGDTDTDEQVNHFDLLNIGLAYGATGPQRPNPSIDWVQQPASDWQLSTPLSQINFKHADTDGNGVVDAADTLAILQNWGLAPQGERGTQAGQEASRRLSTVLYVQPDTVTLGMPAVFDVILGNEASPAEDVYGLAFTIVYDTAAVEPGSVFMAFGDSWIGQQPGSLLGLGRDRYNDGRIDVALTRIDGQNVSGQGAIAQLHITIQDVIFLRSSEYEMILDIENVRLINSAEEWAEIATQSSTIAIGEVVSSAGSPLRDGSLKVYPVPAKDRIFIQSASHPVKRVEVVGMDGRRWASKANVSELSVADLPAGPYFLRIWTEGGVSVRRLVVVR